MRRRKRGGWTQRERGRDAIIGQREPEPPEGFEQTCRRRRNKSRACGNVVALVTHNPSGRPREVHV